MSKARQPKTKPGDGWFRIRHSVLDCPRVQRIAAGLDGPPDLGIEERIDMTIGAVCRVWSWGNRYADRIDRIHHATRETVDRVSGLKGFADAMEAVGWAEFDDDGVTLPNFREHNTPLGRDEPNEESPGDGIDDTIDTVSNEYRSAVSITDTTETPVERERERDRNDTVSIDPVAKKPRGNADDVEKIYKAYPRKVAKVQGKKAIAKAIKSGVDPNELLVLTKAYASTNPTGGAKATERENFCPYPATWFNQRRFEDDHILQIAHPGAVEGAAEARAGPPVCSAPDTRGDLPEWHRAALDKYASDVKADPGWWEKFARDYEAIGRTTARNALQKHDDADGFKRAVYEELLADAD